MELQTVGDRVLKTLAFTHVIHSIRRMNQKHKNDPKNRALQNILFRMLQVFGFSTKAVSCFLFYCVLFLF